MIKYERSIWQQRAGVSGEPGVNQGKSLAKFYQGKNEHNITKKMNTIT